MCQVPFMRICVRSTSPPENRTRRCLPAEWIRSIVRPAIGASSLTRFRAGKTDSNEVTGFPASARCSVRAARKIVSPSGIVVVLGARRWGDRERGGFRCKSTGRPGRPSHLESHCGGVETGINQKWCERVFDGLDGVNLGQKEAPPSILAARYLCKPCRECAAHRGTSRLIFWRERE